MAPRKGLVSLNILTENIRWVESVTLEGDRLSADDLVIRRSMLAGARIDTLGVRVSFLVLAGLMLGNLVFSAVAFVETLQFFQPNYTVFALSLLPLLALGAATYRLRPRQHFTLLLQDGSALGLRSRDGNFLTRCLEAFDRLWTDPVRGAASLYLHVQHRSVDFGPAPVPPSAGIDVVANASQNSPKVGRTAALVETVGPPLPPVYAADEEELEALIPRRMDEPDEKPAGQGRADPKPADANPADEEPSDSARDQVALEDRDGALENTPDDAAEGGHDGALYEAPLPPLPPPLPTDELPEIPQAVHPDADLLVPMDDDLVNAKSDEVVAAPGGPIWEPEPELEPEPEPEPATWEHLPPPEDIPAAAFVGTRPKVEALVRLLRERAPSQGIGDAVDVLELMTRRGCKNEREVRALSRSVQVLHEKMHAYPTAVELMEDVRRAGRLPAAPTPPGR